MGWLEKRNGQPPPIEAVRMESVDMASFSRIRMSRKGPNGTEG